MHVKRVLSKFSFVEIRNGVAYKIYLTVGIGKLSGLSIKFAVKEFN
jgi:hypothetical protein